MISPQEIREQAIRIYPRAIEAWLNEGEHANFPWKLRVNTRLSEHLSDNIRDVEALRYGSKEMIGFGYSVDWESRKSRRFGENNFFPVGIFFESLVDLVRLIGKTSEFKFLETNVTTIRDRIPQLDPWIRRNWKLLLPIEVSTVRELLLATEYLMANPRPGCFARELPIPIPTKLVQRYQHILRGWLDMVLSPDSIDCSCDPTYFEQRYGFRYVQNHIRTRFLDDRLRAELQVFTPELSLPADAIRSMGRNGLHVVVVENLVTLLTLPPMPNAIAFFGMGRGVPQLFDIEWIANSKLTFWGDLDVDGFQILSLFRRNYPKTTSVLMDLCTIKNYEHLGTCGNGTITSEPPYLTPSELEAFRYLNSHNLRIEQEHILQSCVNQVFSTPLEQLK